MYHIYQCEYVKINLLKRL